MSVDWYIGWRILWATFLVFFGLSIPNVRRGFNLMSVFSVTLGSLVQDILYSILDPRIVYWDR